MADEAIGLPPELTKFDPENMRGAILEVPSHVEQGYRMPDSLDLRKMDGKFSAVLIAGMGGSSIAGLLLKSYLEDECIRLDVIQDYVLPKWADNKTLLIACSYSGNTEETLSVFKEARRAECSIVAVTTGGKLEEYTRISKIPTMLLQAGYQPRAAMTVQFFAMLRVLERLKLIPSKAAEVLKLKEDLKNQLQSLEKNAMILSDKLLSKTPIIYTSRRFGTVGYRWKCQFNENSKVMSYNNVFPELNHNEVEGYANTRGNYHAIILRFSEDHRRVQRRMSLTKEIMLRKGISATEIGITGPSLLSKLFSAILLGDLTSYYLALRIGMNPSKVELIEGFKKDLGPYVA
ncbi:bifunctional phosphoglucose/phosphomannose isomerase [Candidatus Woesearchaeota archaeon]|nr:bifunctional phosphoglucose/phosphomannose isomerase [Candidatus Woesearchaeota archaeon]